MRSARLLVLWVLGASSLGTSPSALQSLTDVGPARCSASFAVGFSGPPLTWHLSTPKHKHGKPLASQLRHLAFSADRSSHRGLWAKGPGPKGLTNASERTNCAQLHIAPMQCYTNKHLRFLLRLLSPTAVLWTEMEKVEDLLRSEKARFRRLNHEASEHPLVLQLGGNKADELRDAVALSTKDFRFDEINLNCGCPSIETGGADYGASLMRNPKHTRQLLEAMGEACNVPISVKCRIGVHEELRDGTPPEDEYETLAKFVDEVRRAGVGHFAVHARSAVLAGLSTTKNRSVPPLRYDFVYRLCSDFPELKFTINGGIKGLAAAQSVLTEGQGLQGIMVGRWVLERPLDLWELEAAELLLGRSTTDNERARRVKSRAEAIETYVQYAVREVEGGIPLSEVLMPLVLVSEQIKDDWHIDDFVDSGAEPLSEEELSSVFDAVWDGAMELSTAQSGKRISEAGSGSRSMNKLTKLLKRMMGAKVANKVVRNRAEVLSA